MPEETPVLLQQSTTPIVMPFVKDFEAWNTEKQRIERSDTVKRRYAKINEVWYVKFGINVGTEICGKGDFIRPAIILMEFKDGYFVAPLTTKDGNGHDLRYPIHSSKKLADAGSCVAIEQVRYVSWQRLLKNRNVTIPEEEALFIQRTIASVLFPCTKKPPFPLGETEADPTERKTTEDGSS